MTPPIDSTFALMQLSDSFFPSGSFTLSHGLESLKSLGTIQTVQDLQDMIQQFLHYKIGPTDLVALGAAYQASVIEDIAGIYHADQSLWTQTLVQTTRDTQRQSGRALLMVALDTWPNPQLETLAKEQATSQFHCLHPVVFAVVGCVAGLSRRETALAFVHGLVTGMIGAGIRLGLLGHVQAQKLIHTLASDMTQVVTCANQMSLKDMWSGTPALDIAQMLHSQMPQQLFTN